MCTRHENRCLRDWHIEIDRLQICVKSLFAAAAEGYHPAARRSGVGRYPQLDLRHPRVTFCAGGEKQQQTGFVWSSGQKSQLIWRVVGLTPWGRDEALADIDPCALGALYFALRRQQKIYWAKAEKSKKRRILSNHRIGTYCRVHCLSVCALLFDQTRVEVFDVGMALLAREEMPSNDFDAVLKTWSI